MIHLFTDFGFRGPYRGELHTAVLREAPAVPVVDLMHDAPDRDPQRAAYLLAALAARFEPGDVALCVVDPGVGAGRKAMMLAADGVWFVGPDNGLLELVRRRARRAEAWEILWRPHHLAVSFHGRDLFAPVAARLALGLPVARRALPHPWPTAHRWPDDLAMVIYTDGYGNAMTGLRHEAVTPDRLLEVAGQTVAYGRVFGDNPRGRAFWYVNSAGLVEVAVNGGSAAGVGMVPGVAVTVRGSA